MDQTVYFISVGMVICLDKIQIHNSISLDKLLFFFPIHSSGKNCLHSSDFAFEISAVDNLMLQPHLQK